MDGGVFLYGLAGALAIALLIAAWTDIRRREIDNWLTSGIALVAPAYWFALGLEPWPDMALQAAIGLGVFVVFAFLFAIGAMGGGDVKLLGALALWFPWQALLVLLVLMSLLGGALTLVMAIAHRMRRSEARLEVPYGVAIAAAGLWVLGQRYLNHFV